MSQKKVTSEKTLRTPLVLVNYELHATRAHTSQLLSFLPFPPFSPLLCLNLHDLLSFHQTTPVPTFAFGVHRSALSLHVPIADNLSLPGLPSEAPLNTPLACFTPISPSLGFAWFLGAPPPASERAPGASYMSGEHSC